MRPSPAIATLIAALAASGARAQSQEQAPALETRVWLDRGEEPVLQRGETVRIYYRTSEDAYAAIFRIDTDGHIWLVFPQDPGAGELVKGNRDYRLMLPQSPVWRVGDDPGQGYFFMVASPYPLDFSSFGFDPRTGWDLSTVSSVVYEDPYVAIDDYVAQVVPGWEQVPYALDFLTYNVGNTYSYPRFLCYDCHEARPYAAWNPYTYPCTSFRVVIWDDPYFYPSYRYSGTRVVVARPVLAVPRYSLTSRAPGDPSRPLVRTRDAPPREVVNFKELPTPTPAPQIGRRPAQGIRTVPSASPSRTAGPETGSSRPTLQRRPSARLPVRTPPGGGRNAPSGRPTSVAPSAPGRTSEPEPRVLQPPTRSPRPRTSPAGPSTRAAPPQSTPSRPSTRAVPSRPSSPRPSTRSPAPSRSPAPARPPSSRGAPPSRPSSGSGRSTRPSTPSRGTTRASPAPRASAPRPTVHARPNPRSPRRN